MCVSVMCVCVCASVTCVCMCVRHVCVYVCPSRVCVCECVCVCVCVLGLTKHKLDPRQSYVSWQPLEKLVVIGADFCSIGRRCIQHLFIVSRSLNR